MSLKCVQLFYLSLDQDRLYSGALKAVLVVVVFVVVGHLNALIICTWSDQMDRLLPNVLDVVVVVAVV